MIAFKNHKSSNRFFRVSVLRQYLFLSDLLIVFFVFQINNLLQSLRTLANSYNLFLLNIGSKISSSLFYSSKRYFFCDLCLISSSSFLTLATFFDEFISKFGNDVPYLLIYKKNIISTRGNIFHNFVKTDWVSDFTSFILNFSLSLISLSCGKKSYFV